MKHYNSFVLPALFSLALLGSCNNEMHFENKAYIESPSKIENLLIKPSTVNEVRTLKAAIAQPEDREISLTCKADVALVGTYNAAYYDNAVALPAKYYQMPESGIVIPAGSVRSTEISIRFTGVNELNRDSVYVLPVSIAAANIGVLESARTMYYVFKGAALINVVADMEDNYLHIDQWANAGVVNNLERLTMEALVRARNFDRLISTVMGIEGQFLIRIGDAGFPANQIQIATSSGNFPDGDSNKGLPLNAWTHIALTYDSATGAMKVYVNGKLQSEGTKSAGRVNLGRNGVDGFYIGRSYEDSRYFAGEFAECRIWNVVRTPDEIAANPYEVDPASEGLVAYWKCNEGAGNTVQDHTGNGNHLTSKRNITWTPVSLPASRQ